MGCAMWIVFSMIQDYHDHATLSTCTQLFIENTLKIINFCGHGDPGTVLA